MLSSLNQVEARTWLAAARPPCWRLQASQGSAPAYRSHSTWRRAPRAAPSCRRAPRPSAASEAATLQQTSDSDKLVQELIEFLKEDLTHLFDDQGIDVTKYDENVDFQDPITKYNNLQGYLFNIQFLRWVFSPTFTLHDIKRTGPWEITTRWTMTMRLGHQLNPTGPPRLTFTGTSIMGINPETGRFNRHYDTWDAVQQQQFFSVEAFLHLLSQVFDLKQTPSIETPAYEVLRKAGTYEVRRYKSFPVAEVAMGSGGGNSISSGGGGGVTAFRSLAGYIFGGNERQERMAMTTPVFTDTARSRMQFVLPLRFQDGEAPPAPLPGSGVVTKQEDGGIFAARTFSGIALPEEAAKQEAALRQDLQRDGLQASEGQGGILAQYNDPGVAPPFRRNEVLIPLQNFSMW